MHSSPSENIYITIHENTDRAVFFLAPPDHKKMGGVSCVLINSHIDYNKRRQWATITPGCKKLPISTCQGICYSMKKGLCRCPMCFSAAVIQAGLKL